MADPEILCVGMALVDVLVEGVAAMPRPGETGHVAGVSFATGGDAINEAVALAKLGNRVGLMALIGDDAQGRLIRERCAAIGVMTEGLLVEEPGRVTSTSIVLIDETGERCFLSPRGGSISAFGPEHVDLGRIRPGLRALSIGSLFISSRFDREALAPLLRKAKEVGAITIADMVVDEGGYGLDALAEAWPLLDYVVPSELEAQLYTGLSEPAAIAADFRRRGVANLVLKRGGSGAAAFVGDREVVCPAFEVAAVDTTGAGDTFVAGLVHGLVRGVPIERALSFASAAAALSVEAVGAGAGLKDLAQVEGFLSARSDDMRA